MSAINHSLDSRLAGEPALTFKDLAGLLRASLNTTSHRRTIILDLTLNDRFHER